MPLTRPGRAKKRTITFAALGLAPLLAAGGLALGGGQLLPETGVTLSVNSPLTLQGKGHGHGRGMGQWGAYGYAKQGWNADKILRHYYGNTTAGKVDNPDVTVSLSERNSVNVRADAGAKVGGQTVAPGQAVRLSGGNATITDGCNGAVVKTVPAQWVEPIHAGPNRPANELLTFCDGGKYRGALGFGPDGVANKLNVDDYVKGVIPKESVPAWADSGGFEALKAQAVAARSYVLAGLASGRKMNNTQQSQVYHGVSGEDPRTNRAADATAGQVRMRGGKPALTEFSASTGGYTAGGDFPAVLDEGDRVSPNHRWTATVSPGSIASAFGVGALRSFEVIEANGLGEGSGRVGKVRVVGSNRTVEATGDEVRQKLQLKSDWFSVVGQKSMPKIVKPPMGPATPGGGGLLDFLDLSPLTSLMSGDLPDLSALGLSEFSDVTGQLTPLIEQMITAGLGILGAKQVALDRSDNSQGSLGTVAKDRSDNSQGSLGTVAKDRSDNSQGSTGTVAKPELVVDGKGMHGLVQVLENGVIYYSPLTGAKALLGEAFTDFLNRGGLAVLGFPTADALG
ncbi:SpoIID/LytB domain-containing protein [Gordonia phosphorivorans]|uniref:SpoIID/LytB domain-containing protein n=1 Tax=Gordonia phosphorivorans TaxID=1056982 RepID=A0ABV6HBF2_9ACTN